MESSNKEKRLWNQLNKDLLSHLHILSNFLTPAKELQ